jgi:hypothetical protein
MVSVFVRQYKLRLRGLRATAENHDMIDEPMSSPGITDSRALNDAVEGIKRHRATPHISTDQHVKNRIVQLGRSLDGRAAIYLDTKFWIRLRNAALGIPTMDGAGELLDSLRDLTKAGKIFCPMSGSVFIEVMKQSDGKTRLATARVIDELSLGVTLVAKEMRAKTELAHFIHSFTLERDSVHPLHHLIWTKLAYALGFRYPSSPALDAGSDLAAQKAFVDLMWAIPLADVVAIMGQGMPPEATDYGEVATRLNLMKVLHPRKGRSFVQTYVTELEGQIGDLGDAVMDIACELPAKSGGRSPPRGSPEWADMRKIWNGILFDALKKKGPARQQLRSLHINTSLRAAFLWDERRRFESNDIYDLEHAVAALAHCRAFFTEHSLRTTVTAKHVALDKLYGCAVMSEVSEAMDYLRGLKATGQ